MQNSTNMRILELLQFLYERTDENHPATVSDIIAHLNEKGIQAVRQTVYADTNALIDAGIDIVVVKSTQNQYFMEKLYQPAHMTRNTLRQTLKSTQAAPFTDGYSNLWAGFRS